MSDLYIGLMSGTSLDGIDAALVDLSTQTPTILAAQTSPIEPELRVELLELTQAHARDEIERLGRMDTRLGEIFAHAVSTLLTAKGLDAATVRAIGSHGQTIRHRPTGPQPFTLQIGDPNIIAERTGITTVADFRRRDIAAGGQGAPLVPAFHAACFRSTDEHRAVLNIGGMANLTALPADPNHVVIGFDAGPGNVLMDSWIAKMQGKLFDQDGAWAASGTVVSALLDLLLEEDFFHMTPPKSTGRELFHLGWLEEKLCNSKLAPEDVQATLCALTAQSVANAIRAWAPQSRRLLVCGGGAHNNHLLQTLRLCLTDIRIESTGVYGLEPDWIEAAAFAWMAKETLAGRPTNLPGVTGARHPVILGGIYPGRAWQSGLP